MVTIKNDKLMIYYNPIEINMAFLTDSLFEHIDKWFEEQTGYVLDDLSRDDFNSFMDYLIEELKNGKYDE